MTITSPGADAMQPPAFLGRVVADRSGLTASIMAVLGVRLGLFGALAEHGPCTPAELAAGTGCVERYVREWCHGMAAAGYIERDGDDDVFSIGADARAVLVDATTPFHQSGAYLSLGAMLRAVDPVTEAFRAGGGVAIGDYGEDLFDGTARVTAAAYDHLLVQQWIPLVPGLHQRLAEGIDVLDIGCGRGRAAITIAAAYPASRVVGVDLHRPNVETATQQAAAAGVGDRARFLHVADDDRVEGRFGLVTAFDVLHDATDPAGLLRRMRDALTDDGVAFVVEMRCADTPAGNTGPVATIQYGMSLLYCLTTSLAAGGAGLGTCGMPERVLREIALANGFGRVERLPFEHPVQTLYAISP